jgi:tetratricopeptide (TPR) repeat protein
MSANLVLGKLSDESMPQGAVIASVFDSTLAPRHPLLPAQAQSDFAVGIELIGTGEPRQAAEHLERVLEVAPDFADGHIALGMAYAMESRVYPALDHLERAASLEPGSFFAHFKLGQLYFKLRIPQKGYDEMARALRCMPSVRERKLVAMLLREERQREHSGVQRPWWNKRFSRKTLYFAASLGATVAVMFLRFMYLAR